MKYFIGSPVQFVPDPENPNRVCAATILNVHEDGRVDIGYFVHDSSDTDQPYELRFARNVWWTDHVLSEVSPYFQCLP